MASKLIISVILLLSISASHCDNKSFPWDGDKFKVADALPRSKCEVAFCSTPCEGAAAPPLCPANVPVCSSGCACVPYCDTASIVCFVTSHCTKRRFLTRIRTH